MFDLQTKQCRVISYRYLAEKVVHRQTMTSSAGREPEQLWIILVAYF